MSPRLPAPDEAVAREASVAVGRGAAFHLVAIGLGAVCSFLITIGVSRRLGYDDLGVYSLALAVALGVGLISRAGLDASASHFTAIERTHAPRGERSATAFGATVLAAGIGVAAGLALAIAAPFVAQAIGEPRSEQVLRVLAAGVPFTSVIFVGGACLRGAGGVRLSLIGQVASGVLGLAAVALVLLVGGDVVAVALASVAGIAGAALVTLVLMWREFGAPHALVWRWDLMRFGAGNLVVQLTNFAVVWLGVFVLAAHGTAAQAGYFRAALQTALLLTLVADGLGAFYAPLSSRLLRQDRAALADVSRSMARIGFAFTAIPAIVLVVAPGLVLSPFGENVAPAITALSLLALAHGLAAAAGPVSWALITSDRIGTSILAKVPALAVGGALAWALVPSMGVYGAAIGTAAAVLLRALMHLLLVERVLGLRAVSGRLLAGTALFALVGMAGAIVGAQAPAVAIVLAVVLALLGTAAAWTLLLTAGDRAVLAAVLAKLRRPLARTPGPAATEVVADGTPGQP